MEELIDKSINLRFLNLPQLNELKRLIDDEHLNDILKQKLSGRGERDDDLEYKYDIIIENQRGMKFFGIPLFSKNSLLPFDPSNYQLINGKNLKLINNSINNYPLPDLNWVWHWKTWYILMINDVDDQGWIYSRFYFNSHHWKGKYYFGNFIRRRIWVRLRTRQVELKEDLD